jgi:hypothetical protein
MRGHNWFAAGLTALLLSGGMAIAAAPPPPDDDDDDNAPPATAPRPPALEQQAVPPPVAVAPAAAPQPLPQSPAPPPLPPSPPPPPPVIQAPPPAPLPPPRPAVDTTPVSTDTIELGAEADQLRSAYAQHEGSLGALHGERNAQATQYYGLTSDIGRKLAIGAPPGDAMLTDELARARGALEQLHTNTAQIQAVSDQLTQDANTALHLAGRVSDRIGTPGIGQNERAALAAVEGKVSGAQAAIDQRLRETVAEIARQQRSLGVETQNLAQLERGIAAGALEPAADPTAAARPVAEPAPAPKGGKPGKPGTKTAAVEAPPADGPSKPLFVIGQDSTPSAYQHQLYAAVAAALRRSPNAGFVVRATTPARGSAASQALEASALQHRAADVVRSLSTFGLPRSRITVTQDTDASVAEPQIAVFASPG